MIVDVSDTVHPSTTASVAAAALAEFTVALAGPLDVPLSLEFLRSNRDDLLDRWDGTQLLRTLTSEGETIAYACRPAGTAEAPMLHVTVASTAHQQVIEPIIRATFVAPPPDFANLLTRDPVVAQAEARYPGLRPMRQFDLLAALVRCISAQQVNLRWATTTRRRLAEAFGEQHRVGGQVVYSLKPERLAGAAVAEIRALQFTTRKAEYIIGAAEASASGRLSLEILAVLPDDEVIAQLTKLRGIGRWTAEWILARTLGRPCVVAGDLGVRKAIGAAYLGTPLPAEDAVRQATAHWGASAGVAQALLLHDLALVPPAS
jgi:DNA-3-methyladenine glycosylase II